MSVEGKCREARAARSRLNPVSRSNERLVRRFLELAPHLDRIVAARTQEIESMALSIGIDYSKESSGGGSLPRAVSVVERLENDKVLKAARELKAIFLEAWPLIRRDYAIMIRLHVWGGNSNNRYLGRALGETERWAERSKRLCLAEAWGALRRVFHAKKKRVE